MERRAFTIIELLIVLGVVALLVAIVLPSLAAVRNAGRNAGCLANLQQNAVGFNDYRYHHRDVWPTAWADFLDFPDNQSSASMRCPGDPNARNNLAACSYALADDYLDPHNVRFSAICDGLPKHVIIVIDLGRFHGHRNAAYLDGHANRVAE